MKPHTSVAASSLDEYRALVRVIDEGSFSSAARASGVSKSLISKQIRRLEDRLGVRLLERSARLVATTDAGAAFVVRARDILERADEAEAEAADLQAEARGVLRVSLPMTFGIRYVGPLIPQFLAANPAVLLDAEYTDRKVDIAAEGYDAVVRVGDLADSSLIARRLASVSAWTCASPAYLDARGRPSQPEELAAHECLMFRYSAASHAQTWRFNRADGAQRSVRVNGRLLSSSGEAIRDAALAGFGVARLPDFIVGEAIRQGKLEPVLDEWRASLGGIWALHPDGRHVPAKVRRFIDFLQARLPEVLSQTCAPKP